jgi:hypothetical protein
MNTGKRTKRNAKPLSLWGFTALLIMLLSFSLTPRTGTIVTDMVLNNNATLFLVAGISGMIGLSTGIKYTTYRRSLYYARLTVTK